ncbi:hypothetical protein Tco_0743297 [Tanacetum coccineum]
MKLGRSCTDMLFGSCWLDSAGGVAGRGWGGVVLLLVVILLLYIVSVDLFLFNADESTLPPGQSLGSSENTTRFPVPSDVCKDQLSSGIFTSSSYDDDFSATLTNLAPAVEKENPMDVKSALSPMEEIEKSHNYEEVLLTRPLFHQKIPGIYFGYRFLWKDIILGSINKAWALCEGFGRQDKSMIVHLCISQLQYLTLMFALVLVPDIKLTPLTYLLECQSRDFQVSKRATKIRLVEIHYRWMSTSGQKVNFMAVAKEAEYCVTTPSTKASIFAASCVDRFEYLVVIWDGELLFREIGGRHTAASLYFFLLEQTLVSAGIVYAVNTSIYAAELFDIAGWLVSATSHLVSAGSLQSCWCNNVSAE